jgi:hypothetical protein
VHNLFTNYPDYGKNDKKFDLALRIIFYCMASIGINGKEFTALDVINEFNLEMSEQQLDSFLDVVSTVGFFSRSFNINVKTKYKSYFKTIEEHTNLPLQYQE